MLPLARKTAAAGGRTAGPNTHESKHATLLDSCQLLLCSRLVRYSHTDPRSTRPINADEPRCAKGGTAGGNPSPQALNPNPNVGSEEGGHGSRIALAGHAHGVRKQQARASTRAHITYDICLGVHNLTCNL